MRLGILLTALLYILTVFGLQGQSLREEIAANPRKAGTIYYAYSYQDIPSTPAPEGYIPFYISHYGRHGSRWLLTPSEYSAVMDVFDAAAAAGALTSVGEDVYKRVRSVYADGLDRAGSLTPLGASQHRGIAERMFGSYPEVFHGDANIFARSTIIVRCVISMAEFCERLKELNPALRITRQADGRSTRYLEFFYRDFNTISDRYLNFMENGDWVSEAEELLWENVDPNRLPANLFLPEFAQTIDSRELVRGLFLYAVSLQNTDLDISLFDIFTADELYWMYVRDNYRYYVRRGSSPLNMSFPQFYARSLLGDILMGAEQAVSGGDVAADLRFGHDLNIMALIPLMRIDGWDLAEKDPIEVASKWPVYRLSPMAANLQMVFYRNERAGEVMVKILFNEQEARIPIESDTAPYYRWNDVLKLYSDIMESTHLPDEGDTERDKKN